MEGWRYCVARFSSLLVSGAILSACYAPIVTPTQSEVVTEPVASEVVEMHLETKIMETELPVTEQSTATLTLEATIPTATLEPTPDFGNLAGIIFHDKNGTGVRDLYGDWDIVKSKGEYKVEEGIPGVEVCVDKQGTFCTITGEDGSFKIADVPFGQHKILLKSPSDDPEEAFRYTNQSKGIVEVESYSIGDETVPAQILTMPTRRRISSPPIVDFYPGEELEIGLTQGYLIFPFFCADLQNIDKIQYFDIDGIPTVKNGAFRDYMGGKNTYDRHQGTDWGSNSLSIIGTYVLAADSGVVEIAGERENEFLPGVQIDKAVGIVNIPRNQAARYEKEAQETGRIRPPPSPSRTGYGHLDHVLVEVGDYVEQGQIIGELGMTSTSWPHLHLNFGPGIDKNTLMINFTDPFRNLYDLSGEEFSYFTDDNNPICRPMQLSLP